MWIIYEKQLDPIKNQSRAAIFDAVKGYVDTEGEAIKYCAAGKVYTNRDCWAIRGEVNQYWYDTIEKL